jgi:hypothetical protein
LSSLLNSSPDTAHGINLRECGAGNYLDAQNSRLAFLFFPPLPFAFNQL